MLNIGLIELNFEICEEKTKMDSQINHSDDGKCDHHPSDYFNQIIGHIEDIVISNDFQTLQKSFMNEFYHEFTDNEENKIIYMDIFNKYTNIIETFIVTNLQKQMSDIDMCKFTDELKQLDSTFDGEIFELLFSLSDFQTFKTMMLDYKEFKTGKYNDMNLNDVFIVKKLN